MYLFHNTKCYILITVPVAFGLLPSKKKEAYASLFGGLKDLLDDLDLELSADYIMADFETNIKYVLKSVAKSN